MLGRANDFQHVLDVDRLHEMCGEAGLARSLTVALLSVAGDRDECHIRRFGKLAQAARELESVHDRKPEVQERNVVQAVARSAQGLGPVVSHVYVDAIRAEAEREHVCGIDVIVDQKHAHRGWRRHVPRNGISILSMSL